MIEPLFQSFVLTLMSISLTVFVFELAIKKIELLRRINLPGALKIVGACLFCGNFILFVSVLQHIGSDKVQFFVSIPWLVVVYTYLYRRALPVFNPPPK
ncbi:hypothetical protein [Reinekea sp. G2M2-21]|uniref:hypothetical protein n=1 Tax=Reinekea sp. G2M2-21 TaxID=2788942 RepID=UPI0018AC678F|nr:hypothetical protein [Reinekea sp. G2M2-21]